MVHGIPLAAIMDPGDIVRDIEAGAGIWVRNGQAKELAQAIRKLSRDPARCRVMSETCRRFYAEKYTKEIGTGKYTQMFRQLLCPGDEERQEL